MRTNNIVHKKPTEMARGNLTNIASMISEAGFTSQREFSRKSGIEATKISRMANGRYIPSPEEEEVLRTCLGKVSDFEGRLLKYKHGVSKSRGRLKKNGKKKKTKKKGTKASIHPGEAKRSLKKSTGAPSMKETLAHLMLLEGVPDDLIAHVVNYYNKR